MKYQLEEKKLSPGTVRPLLERGIRSRGARTDAAFCHRARRKAAEAQADLSNYRWLRTAIINNNNDGKAGGISRALPRVKCVPGIKRLMGIHAPSKFLRFWVTSRPFCCRRRGFELWRAKNAKFRHGGLLRAL